MGKSREKHIQYGMIILDAIASKLEDGTISAEELNEGDNMTEFIHAAANVAPAILYTRLSGDQVDYLGFNHIANRLCFQFTDHGKE